MISAADPWPRRRAVVLGRSMAYVEAGAGRPVVLLHGNPTSSYLWRNVIPHVAPVARCIAPDLIGMGDSDKLPSSDDDAYRYAVHRDHLEGLLDALDLGDGVVMVGQDWGSVLAFDWARRHAGRMGGIVHFEAIVTPFTWEEFPENPEDTDSTRRWFERLRSVEGERRSSRRTCSWRPASPRAPCATSPKRRWTPAAGPSPSPEKVGARR